MRERHFDRTWPSPARLRQLAAAGANANKLARWRHAAISRSTLNHERGRTKLRIESRAVFLSHDFTSPKGAF